MYNITYKEVIHKESIWTY